MDWPVRISRGHLPGLHNLPREKFASFLSSENDSRVGEVNISEEFTLNNHDSAC